jgi:uncharacterized membrane protein
MIFPLFLANQQIEAPFYEFFKYFIGYFTFFTFAASFASRFQTLFGWNARIKMYGKGISGIDNNNNWKFSPVNFSASVNLCDVEFHLNKFA